MNSDDGDAGDVADWVALRCIQMANDASMGAMEQYLVAATYPGAVGNPERAYELLERAITHHEQAIEHLELAASTIDTET